MTKERTTPVKEQPTFREEGLKPAQIRLLIAIFVSAFVLFFIAFDFGNDLWLISIFLFGQWIPWLRVEYWVQLGSGVLVFCFMVGFMLYLEARQRAKGEEFWLAKYGDEIGWPLMIL